MARRVVSTKDKIILWTLGILFGVGALCWLANLPNERERFETEAVVLKLRTYRSSSRYTFGDRRRCAITIAYSYEDALAGLSLDERYALEDDNERFLAINYFDDMDRVYLRQGAKAW